MNQPRDLFGVCPYVTAQRIFSGKWSILIMYALNERAHRFGELQRRLGDITQTTLTKQLKELESYGLVLRTVYAVIPPKVEYSLTELGQKFLPVLNALGAFGKDYIESLRGHIAP